MGRENLSWLGASKFLLYCLRQHLNLIDRKVRALVSIDIPLQYLVFYQAWSCSWTICVSFCPLNSAFDVYYPLIIAWFSWIRHRSSSFCFLNFQMWQCSRTLAREHSPARSPPVGPHFQTKRIGMRDSLCPRGAGCPPSPSYPLSTFCYSEWPWSFWRTTAYRLKLREQCFRVRAMQATGVVCR